MSIALLLPLTLFMPTNGAIALLLGAYQGSMFGGSISSILINTPGTAAAAATALDGHPLAKQGHAAKALQMALYASVTGGLIGCVILLLGAQSLAVITLQFGTPEYFGMMLMSLVLISGVSGKSLLKGLMAASIGLAASTVGMELIFGVRRFTFGSMTLLDGFGPLPMFIGMFAFSEIFMALTESREKLNSKPELIVGKESRLTFKEYWSQRTVLLIGGIVGSFIGILPGIGGSTASFLAYAEAQRRSKTPEKFGTGCLEGVAAPEAASNAQASGALVPVLTLGIPGDVVTALIIGALVAHGIRPGPLMFVENLGQVYMIYICMVFAVITLAIVGTAGVRVFYNLVKVKKSILFPLIVVICVIGTFAARTNFFDSFSMLGFGILGYALKRGGFPIPPLAIAFIIGPFLENSMRQSLILSRGSPVIFFTRPISLFLMILSVFICIYMVRRNIKENRKQASN